MPEKLTARASIHAEEVELDEVTIAGTPGWEKSKGTVVDKSGLQHTNQAVLEIWLSKL
jgi:hypothetical protein